jgi:hypothetical protein
MNPPLRRIHSDETLPTRTCITSTTRHKTNGSRVILCQRRAPTIEPGISAAKFP